MGPINEWWTAGFDGGENALIGFSTGTECNTVNWLLFVMYQFSPFSSVPSMTNSHTHVQ